MATFKALVSGLPLSAKELLNEALTASFGEGVVDLVSLNKDNLRQMVRLSTRDVQVVLVVLDEVSEELCKDIENGLYSTDKYLLYTSDADMVQSLNNKFSINLSVPEESPLEVGEEELEQKKQGNSALIQEYIMRIQDKDMLIKNLEATIFSLKERIQKLETSSEDEEKTEEIESLHQQVIDLNGRIQELESSKRSLEEEKDLLQKDFDKVNRKYQDLQKSNEVLIKDYKTLNEDLTKERLQSTSMSGMIRTLEGKVHSLESSNVELSAKADSVDSIKKEKSLLQSRVSSLETKISNLSSDNTAKSEEIDRLNRELSSKGDVNKIVEDLKADIDSLQMDKSSLEKKLSEAESRVEQLQSGNSEDTSLIAKLKEEIEELKQRSDVDSKSLTQLNQEKIELLAKLDTLSKSTDRDTNVEDIMSELNQLKEEYSSLKSSVFSQIASYAMPKGSSPIFLTRKQGIMLRNTRFTFAGNAESRKGAYKCLLNEFKGYTGNDRILIVDVVAETSIDYVFEIKKVVPGIDWFRKGGGVQRYLSNTCLKNVQVLSPGLGYCNEAYFLTVDWESRLTELENSGYKVVLFFGDISNMCGRIFHESFADIGNSIIYVHGNAIGSRTIVSNLKGLSNGKNSIVAYFDFNSQVRRFYDMVSKTNECRVLSVLGGK